MPDDQNTTVETETNSENDPDILTSLTEVCQELRNWFDRGRYNGTFEISNGIITADFLVSGQYYRIIGSLFNDGVHKYGDVNDTLTDETFDGAIWSMAVPKPVIKLVTEIAKWRLRYESADSTNMSPFVSESFAGYSYSKGGAGSGSSEAATPTSWKTAFRSNLNAWRKL